VIGDLASRSDNVAQQHLDPRSQMNRALAGGDRGPPCSLAREVNSMVGSFLP
jgi:hypothetical protein